MKRYSIFLYALAALLPLIIGLVLLPTVAYASKSVGKINPPAGPPAPGRGPTEEEKRSTSITASGQAVDPGSGVAFNVPNLPSGVTVNYDIRNPAPQDSNGVYGLGPLVGVNFTGGNALVEVRIPIPKGFNGRSLVIAQYVDGKYVLVSGYQSENYMVFRTRSGGDFAIVESAYVK